MCARARECVWYVYVCTCVCVCVCVCALVCVLVLAYTGAGRPGAFLETAREWAGHSFFFFKDPGCQSCTIKAYFNIYT